MSDFLKNLRSNQRGQRPGGPTRKDMDGHFYPNDRRKMKDRRSMQGAYETSGTRLGEAFAENIPFIKESMTQIATSLERLSESQESLEQTRVEQSRAIANFLNNLNLILEEKVTPFLEKAGQRAETPPKVTTSYASGTHHTKDEVIKVIKTMRKNRSTFAEIAEHLTKEGIPTFSGRGDWHAQTIHRLCK